MQTGRQGEGSVCLRGRGPSGPGKERGETSRSGERDYDLEGGPAGGKKGGGFPRGRRYVDRKGYRSRGMRFLRREENHVWGGSVFPVGVRG